MEVAVRHSFVIWQVPSEVTSVFFSYSSFLSIIHSPYLYFQWPHRQIHHSHFLLHNGIGRHFPRSWWHWNKCIDLNKWVIATKMPYRLNKHIFANSVNCQSFVQVHSPNQIFWAVCSMHIYLNYKKTLFNSRSSNIFHTLRGCYNQW